MGVRPKPKQQDSNHMPNQTDAQLKSNGDIPVCRGSFEGHFGYFGYFGLPPKRGTFDKRALKPPPGSLNTKNRLPYPKP